MTPHIVLVCGGRDYADADTLRAHLARHHLATPIDVLIEGGARGADSMAAAWARGNCVHVAEVAALWDCHRKAAGHRRNAAILALRPDLVIAFPGGAGTADMVWRAERAGIPVVRPAGDALIRPAGGGR